ncbi:hypothetical protein P4S95_27310 [Aneurinibacillus aneurinilyticus]|uniref:hypothetical protein n=1 Tax=Aneurinibacillus aneurinilyticus TaxID=1391 RepID=UPI002E1C7DB7|nr:hypothetical protein [Aneurinibacillus aneurinilyticus]
MKKRQLKKVFKIVAKQINSGDFTKLKPVYFRIIDKTLANFVERKYINEFRSWWYDQDWSKFDLTTEILRCYKKWDKEFEEWSGINMDLYTRYFQQNHKKSA